MEIEKIYDAKKVEEKWVKFWADEKIFLVRKLTNRSALMATNNIDISSITTSAIPPSANCSLKLMSAAVASIGKNNKIATRNFNIINLQLLNER